MSATQKNSASFKANFFWQNKVQMLYNSMQKIGMQKIAKKSNNCLFCVENKKKLIHIVYNNFFHSAINPALDCWCCCCIIPVFSCSTGYAPG